MSSQHERTLKMKADYIRLHTEENLTPKQIAARYDLHVSTVYNCLQEIADQAGVSRESLLITPRAKHLTHERRFDPVKPVDLTNFQQHTQATLDEFDGTLAVIAQHIQTAEIQQQCLTEEEEAWLS